MPLRLTVPVALAGAILALAGCVPQGETGYVEIKTVPTVASPVLYLDRTKLDPIRNGVAVLRQEVGTVKLQADGGGRLAPLCELVVRKNRITSVTVSALERPMRCQCRYSDAGSPRACIS